jgi:hypothetical protein
LRPQRPSEAAAPDLSGRMLVHPAKVLEQRRFFGFVIEREERRESN